MIRTAPQCICRPHKSVQKTQFIKINRDQKDRAPAKYVYIFLERYSRYLCDFAVQLLDRLVDPVKEGSWKCRRHRRGPKDKRFASGITAAAQHHGACDSGAPWMTRAMILSIKCRKLHIIARWLGARRIKRGCMRLLPDREFNLSSATEFPVSAFRLTVVEEVWEKIWSEAALE